MTTSGDRIRLVAEPREGDVPMDDRFDDKPLKAEVIDMDRVRKARSRPSAVFSERVETAIGSGPDDPGFRYLFDDNDDRNPRRGSKTLKRLSSMIVTVILAMGSAWVVWTVPGFGPQEHQARLADRLAASETRLAEMESRLVQAQARVIELTRAVEIQNTLIDQGESLRRSMTTSLEKLAENSRRISEDQAAAAIRIETIESGLKDQKSTLRKHDESIAGLDSALVEGLARVQFTSEKLERRIQTQRLEFEAAQRDSFFELTKFVQEEMSALRDGDLKSLRTRVERLAEHVWNEVGRLDGRFVRIVDVPRIAEAPAETITR